MDKEDFASYLTIASSVGKGESKASALRLNVSYKEK
jgi:hypothetical protein